MVIVSRCLILVYSVYLFVGEPRVRLHGLQRGGVVGLSVEQQTGDGGPRARPARARARRHAKPGPRGRRRVQRAPSAACRTPGARRAPRTRCAARHARAHRLRHLVHCLHIG